MRVFPNTGVMACSVCYAEATAGTEGKVTFKFDDSVWDLFEKEMTAWATLPIKRQTKLFEQEDFRLYNDCQEKMVTLLLLIKDDKTAQHALRMYVASRFLLIFPKRMDTQPSNIRAKGSSI